MPESDSGQAGLMRAPCGCLRDGDSVGTCPVCLPSGAIERMIVGDQMELFEDRGVVPVERGREPDSTVRSDLAKSDLGEKLPGLPF